MAKNLGIYAHTVILVLNGLSSTLYIGSTFFQYKSGDMYFVLIAVQHDAQYTIDNQYLRQIAGSATSKKLKPKNAIYLITIKHIIQFCNNDLCLEHITINIKDT